MLERIEEMRKRRSIMKPNYCVCCGIDLNEHKCDCSKKNLTIMFL